jgi:hypothetical protein
MKISDHLGCAIGASRAIEINSEQQLIGFLADRQREKPHFVELVWSDGSVLLVGVGGLLATVQHTGPGGNPPYLVVRNESKDSTETLDFFMEDTPTPIWVHLCIPFQQMLDIAVTFYRTGKPLETVKWEEV